MTTGGAVDPSSSSQLQVRSSAQTSEGSESEMTSRVASELTLVEAWMWSTTKARAAGNCGVEAPPLSPQIDTALMLPLGQPNGESWTCTAFCPKARLLREAGVDPEVDGVPPDANPLHGKVVPGVTPQRIRHPFVRAYPESHLRLATDIASQTSLLSCEEDVMFGTCSLFRQLHIHTYMTPNRLFR